MTLSQKHGAPLQDGAPERPEPPPPHPDPVALARMILRRVGVRPLLALAIVPYAADPPPAGATDGRTGAVHATATASARIVGSGVRAGAGQSGTVETPAVTVPIVPRHRPCDPPRATGSAPAATRAPGACRMIIIDMP